MVVTVVNVVVVLAMVMLVVVVEVAMVQVKVTGGGDSGWCNGGSGGQVTIAAVAHKDMAWHS